MHTPTLLLPSIVILAVRLASAEPTKTSTEEITIRVTSDTLHSIDTRLFGQFLEKASWGEPGPEHAFVPGTTRLQPEVITMLKQMRIPIVRFPGGTDVDWMDWRDLIDNVPGRGEQRPVSTGHRGGTLENKFGIHEYFALRDTLGCQTIFVVNILDALARRIPLEDAAQRIAGLVAYLNATDRDTLPPGMPNWPSIRKQNGHPAPFRAEYLQLGNELWLKKFWKEASGGAGYENTDSLRAWYKTCFRTVIAEVRKVDTDIGILTDLAMGPLVEHSVWEDDYIRENLSYGCAHIYSPMSMQRMKVDGVPVTEKAPSDQRLWQAWTSMPGAFDSSGFNTAISHKIGPAIASKVPVACTEWNWNGWDFGAIEPQPGIGWETASAIGAASFLNGLLRLGNRVKIGSQSMLVGSSWGITAIRVDSAYRTKPYFFPQAMATSLYSKFHGSVVARTEISGIPRFDNPLDDKQDIDGGIAEIDPVVTRSGNRLFLHSVNRHFDSSRTVVLDCSPLGGKIQSATIHTLTGGIDPDITGQVCSVSKTALPVNHPSRSSIVLPPRSANIVVVELSPPAP